MKEKSLKQLIKEFIEIIDKKINEVKECKETSKDFKNGFIIYLKANKKAYTKYLKKIKNANKQTN